MQEVTIESIRVSLVNYQRVIILKVNSNDRYIPIWVGSNEADAIAIRLQKISLPRPLTHDLIISMLDEISLKIEYVLIDEIKEETYFAKIAIKINEKISLIDSRASDAMALAVRTSCPIYVKDEVVESASVFLDHESETALTVEGEIKNTNSRLGLETAVELSDFAEFIETLDLENLGEN
jgi:bifunctional DNase/RNase